LLFQNILYQFGSLPPAGNGHPDFSWVIIKECHTWGDLIVPLVLLFIRIHTYSKYEN